MGWLDFAGVEEAICEKEFPISARLMGITDWPSQGGPDNITDNWRDSATDHIAERPTNVKHYEHTLGT